MTAKPVTVPAVDDVFAAYSGVASGVSDVIVAVLVHEPGSTAVTKTAVSKNPGSVVCWHVTVLPVTAQSVGLLIESMRKFDPASQRSSRPTARSSDR